jgi:hypothetical protein
MRRLASMAASMLVAITWNAHAGEVAAVSDPTKTAYGDLNPRAPAELRAFSFLIGKWDGTARAKLQDGYSPWFPITWIGRYVLDGTAIADELHSVNPDGSPALGITFRQYDAARKAWIIEFLNVTGSFLRKQVRAGVGAVVLDGRNVTVASESPGMMIRENYLVPDDNNMAYRLDTSTDGGKTWTEAKFEMKFRRVE